MLTYVNYGIWLVAVFLLGVLTGTILEIRRAIRCQ